MLIAVFSDTHLRAGKSLPTFVWQHLTNVNLILHAGDLTHIGLLEELGCIAPVRAVRGNCDSWDSSLPERDIFECEEVKIGLIHGDSGNGRSTQDRAYNAFKNSEVELIVFGHSHIPFMEMRNGILMFNPGSPTDKRREPQYSFGLVSIQQGQIKAEHLYF
ncbi:MAG: metallophosphoesterase family protein [Bacillota bacterium]|nr:metallophosphoesterase family protein [Bacillota bacterium]MDP4158542.1 metallophosphoesterase family protein [Bacillota bacterium]